MSVREPISIDYQCATKSRSAWKQSLIVQYIFRAEFTVKTDESPQAGWMELAGRIWPADQTLPTTALKNESAAIPRVRPLGIQPNRDWLKKYPVKTKNRKQL